MVWFGLARLHLDARQGGITIDTPATIPVLRTVIQFDGDILNIVFSDENGNLPEPAVLRQLYGAHRKALAKQIGVYAGWQVWMARARRMAPWLSGAGWAYAGGDAYIVHSLTLFGAYAGAAAMPLALRMAGPFAVGPLFKAAALLVVRERKHENEMECDRLKQKRGEGDASSRHSTYFARVWDWLRRKGGAAGG